MAGLAGSPCCAGCDCGVVSDAALSLELLLVLDGASLMLTSLDACVATTLY